ncbi:hypothetical protein F4824DRAFT_23795 [Ustulina deusta]|nr:hypothetical protein F4824DRAFT_23795 [Ustulina deusta]
MSNKTIKSESMEGWDVQFAKLQVAQSKMKADYEAEFHLFGKLPVELQDLIWKAALPSEIINSNQEPRDRNRTQSPGIPAMASVCKASREIALRYGVWLKTPQSSIPMFFIPDISVLHCGQGIELTVTANQVMLGLDPILMRMAVHFNALNVLEDMIILVSNGEPGRIPGTWHRTFDGRVLARVEICHLNSRGPAQRRMYSEELYYPRMEWTSKRWEEIEMAAKRAWLLAAWHLKDPVGIGERDILDPSRWFSGRGNWIARELHLMPKLVAAYMRNSV